MTYSECLLPSKMARIILTYCNDIPSSRTSCSIVKESPVYHTVYITHMFASVLRKMTNFSYLLHVFIIAHSSSVAPVNRRGRASAHTDNSHSRSSAKCREAAGLGRVSWPADLLAAFG